MSNKPEGLNGIQMEELVREVIGWRNHWKKSSFFKAVVFSFVFSLLDTGTDFNFAWNVPMDCPNDTFPETFPGPFASSPCGFIHPKKVEFLTYTYIAVPGILFSLSAASCLLKGLICKCCAGKVPDVLALFAHTGLCFGLFLAAAYNDLWTPLFPTLAQGYAYIIRALAYLSAAWIMGVKLLGLVSHGPETSRLVFQVTGFEMRYEAALQLALVATITISSGKCTWAGIFSGLSSTLVIGKVGVETFLNSYVSEASLLGKICIAASVFPVFVLTALFKIGSVAIVNAWDVTIGPGLILLALGIPCLLIFVTKSWLLSTYLTLPSIGQGVIAELLTLHIWPRGRLGEKIGLAITVFNFLLFSSSLAWVIAAPEEGSLINWTKEASEGIYKEWASESVARLHTSSISCLIIGCPTSLLVICLLIFQNKFVENVVFTYSDKYKQEEDISDQLHTAKDKDPANKGCDMKAEVNNVLIEEDDSDPGHKIEGEVVEEEG